MSLPIFHSQYTAEQIETAIGKAPRVSSSGYWEVWNVANGAYESTGVGAGVTPPTVVTQVSQMTNHGYIYIYNGSETGYTAGYWYYWDGSAWTAGGAYQVAATDPTLSVEGAAADAKATGADLKILENHEFSVPYEPSNMTKVDGLIYLEQGYVAVDTGKTTASSSGKYYRSQIGNSGSGTFLEIGSQALMLVIGLDWVQCSCWSYSGTTNSTATHSNTGSKYVNGSKRIFIPHNSTDKRFTLSFRKVDQSVFSAAELAELKSAIKFYRVTDVNLVTSGSPADAKVTGNKMSAFQSNIYKYNYYDVLSLGNGSTSSSGGITYTKNSNGTWTIDGTSTSTSFCNIVSSQNAVPDYIVPGRKYRFSFNGGSVPVQIFIYKDGNSTNKIYTSDFDFTIPSLDDMDGIIIRFRLDSGKTIDNETVMYQMMPVPMQDNTPVIDYTIGYFDALELGNGASHQSRNGVTYDKNPDGTWTINGTASALSFGNIINSTTKVPPYIVPGRRYHFRFNGGTVGIQIFIYKNGEYTHIYQYSSDFNFTIPSLDDMDGIIVRFRVPEGGTVNNQTVNYTFGPEAEENIDNHYTYNTTVEKTEQIYNNSFEITVNPEITTDSHNWLAAVDTNTEDETGKTDMTPAIMAMLTETGYCHLGEGIFYVSGNIDLPSGSMLTGCGRKTVVRLLSSVESGYVVKLTSLSTLSNLRISGQYSETSKSSQGTRVGVLFAANDDGQEGATASDTSCCMISDVWIGGFTDSGIKCHNSSMSVPRGLYATNVYIGYCWAGINIDYRSEFNKFVNVVTNSCYYGCINNGGNNTFTSCTFGANSVGFYIDGSKYNSGHGTINGCTFCHVGSNAGSAITMVGVANGFVVSGCQVWYCSIDLTNCSGISFVGCEFGRGTTSRGATINISGGNLVLFDGCLFMNDLTYPPDITITNNTKVRWGDCYGAASGSRVTA